MGWFGDAYTNGYDKGYNNCLKDMEEKAKRNTCRMRYGFMPGYCKYVECDECGWTINEDAIGGEDLENFVIDNIKRCPYCGRLVLRES